MTRRTRLRIGAAFLFALPLGCAAVVIFPYYWMFASSVERASLFQWPPAILPSDFTWDTYAKVLTERPVLLWMTNTAIVACSTAIFCTIVGGPELRVARNAARPPATRATNNNKRRAGLIGDTPVGSGHFSPDFSPALTMRLKGQGLVNRCFAGRVKNQ